MTLTKQILKLLSSARQGMTMRQIYKIVDYHGDHRTLHVNISQMILRGSVRRDGSSDCSHCGHSSAVYRITDQGRIHLNANSHDRVSKSMEFA